MKTLLLVLGAAALMGCAHPQAGHTTAYHNTGARGTYCLGEEPCAVDGFSACVIRPNQCVTIKKQPASLF